MKAEEFYDNELSKYNLLNLIDPATAKQAMQMMEEYHQSRVNAISEEDISDKIEYFIENHGYKMHDLSMENDCVTHGQVENLIQWFKEQLLNN